MLTLKPETAELSNSGIKRLPDALAETIRRFVANKLTRSALEQAIPSDKSAILEAMGGASAAICGAFTVTAKQVKPVDPSIKLKDGRSIKLTEVKAFTTSTGQVFTVGEIASVFGGRAGYTDISVAE